MEKHIHTYETFESEESPAAVITQATNVHPDEVSMDNRTEAERVKDEILEETEAQSDSIDATRIVMDESKSFQFIKTFKQYEGK